MTLSRRIVQAARGVTFDQLPAEAVAKVKTALLDVLCCALESRGLPWSEQAIQIAARSKGGGAAPVIGTDLRVPPGEAAFANATLAHGLVREDMHTGSVSHLGVVVFPTLLAMAHRRRVSGREFVTAAVCGYEIGASIGRALMDAEIVRQYRPTGITGPLGAAVAGSRLLDLDEEATISALGFAANATVGFNEWPYSGADEMFFHVGFAARNAVASVELAELGARASKTALDGRAGLFAALRRIEKACAVAPFSGSRLEILSVFHKPAPACNYAQTASQAALAVAVEEGIASREIVAIAAKVSDAAVNYPGCNFAGPYKGILQAKMSIHYCVAAALARRAIEEANYREPSDPEINRLAGITTVEADPAFTAAYPKLQGAEVTVTLRDGRTVRRGLDDLIPATPAEVGTRFRAASEKALGKAATAALESKIDCIEEQEDLASLL